MPVGLETVSINAKRVFLVTFSKIGLMISSLEFTGNGISTITVSAQDLDVKKSTSFQQA